MTINFATDGTAKCLYSELIDLTTLGALKVRRASNVEFNQSTQRWEVKNLQRQVIFKNKSRQRCLEWEHEHYAK